MICVEALTHQLKQLSIFLAPSFAARVATFIISPFGFIGEGALTVWLLAFGVNVAVEIMGRCDTGYAG